jgi:hypothetical protein
MEMSAGPGTQAAISAPTCVAKPVKRCYSLRLPFRPSLRSKDLQMLTDYLVKCPHMHCQWFGSLPASSDVEYGHGASLNVSIVTFQCPRCQRVWQARLIGDDLETIPLEAEEDLAMSWPEVDLGVGG